MTGWLPRPIRRGSAGCAASLTPTAGSTGLAGWRTPPPPSPPPSTPGSASSATSTADDRAAVFHDSELDRLTGETGPAAARTLAELARIGLRESSDTIPPLTDLLALVAGRAPLLIELKSREDLPVAPLCRAVWRDLAGYRGPHAVMSFDPRVGHWFARHAPETVRGLVASERLDRSWRGSLRLRLALWRARPDFLACDVRDLPSPFAAAQRARGLPVLTWTVATPDLRQRALAHADGWIAEAEGVVTAPASA